jgi:hypothetical protein
VENNLKIDDIIEMGGHVELTGPLMMFVAEKGVEPVNNTEYAKDNAFAIVVLADKSRLQILHRKINGIYGVITEARRPLGLTDVEDMGVSPVPEDEINGNHFVTTWADLEFALKEKRKEK